MTIFEITLLELLTTLVLLDNSDNTTLHDRLKSRGYGEKKLRDNLECEIFQTILDEARDSYDTQIVHELRSDTDKDLKENISRIVRWVKQWKVDHSGDP